MAEFAAGPCPACGDQIESQEHAAEHYLTGCRTKVFCENCGVPIPFEKLRVHPDYCIGQTRFILHNRKAGMVVYLTETEWEALHDPIARGTEFDAELAYAIVQRAVFGVEFEVALPPETD